LVRSKAELINIGVDIIAAKIAGYMK